VRRAGLGRGKRERKGKRHVDAGGNLDALLAHRELQAIRYPNSAEAHRKLLDTRAAVARRDGRA
jgi:hypothetical protein